MIFYGFVFVLYWLRSFDTYLSYYLAPDILDLL
jgi:hypothetical protein